MFVLLPASILVAKIYMYACMNINSVNIDLYTYLYCFHTCCMDLHVCLYEYHILQSYINIYVVSILVTWIYMYVCMSINRFHIVLYTYLCRFHTFCIDLQVCLYEYQSVLNIDLYKNSYYFHTCCMDLQLCLYEYKSFSHSLIYTCVFVYIDLYT